MNFDHNKISGKEKIVFLIWINKNQNWRFESFIIYYIIGRCIKKMH
jgi:hypothetical protein